MRKIQTLGVDVCMVAAPAKKELSRLESCGRPWSMRRYMLESPRVSSRAYRYMSQYMRDVRIMDLVYHACRYRTLRALEIVEDGAMHSMLKGECLEACGCEPSMGIYYPLSRDGEACSYLLEGIDIPSRTGTGLFYRLGMAFGILWE